MGNDATTVSYMTNESSENGSSSPPGTFEFDRERGIFTPRDRRFLAGALDDELSDEAKRQKRYRLRRRVLNALQDLHYLGAMDFKDTNAIGHELHDEEDMESRFNSAVYELMNYFYDLYGDEGFLDLLEFALEWQRKTEHYARTSRYIEVDVDIQITAGETISLGELAERSHDRELTPIEKIILGESGGHENYQPRHPELIPDIERCVYDKAGSLGADWDEVCDLLVERTEATWAEANEALEDYLLLGFTKTIGPGRALQFRENGFDAPDPPDE